MTVEINVEKLKLALKENKFNEFFNNRVESLKKMCHEIESGDNIRYRKLDDATYIDQFPSDRGKWEKIRLLPGHTHRDPKFEVLEIVDYSNYNCCMIVDNFYFKNYYILINGINLTITHRDDSWQEDIRECLDEKNGINYIQVDIIGPGNYIITTCMIADFDKILTSMKNLPKDVLFEFGSNNEGSRLVFSECIVSDGITMDADLKDQQSYMIKEFYKNL